MLLHKIADQNDIYKLILRSISLLYEMLLIQDAKSQPVGADEFFKKSDYILIWRPRFQPYIMVIPLFLFFHVVASSSFSGLVVLHKTNKFQMQLQLKYKLEARNEKWKQKLKKNIKNVIKFNLLFFCLLSPINEIRM